MPPLDWVTQNVRSDIEVFARAYWEGSYSEDNFVIALSGYNAFFDRSADHDLQSVGGTVVAGFVSTVEQWALWEKDWKAVLDEFHVRYFHMREFNSYNGEFTDSKWREELHRRYFVASLAATIKNWAVASIADYMDHQIYRDANKLCETDKIFNPYVECGRNCALHTQDFIRNKVKSDLPISYVFERGDEGVGMLMDFMERCNLPCPTFKRPRVNPQNPDLDREDPPMIQLQAADLLAWEIRRWKNDYRNGAKMRQSMKAFCGLEQNIWKECTYTDMARLIRSAGIPRRGQNVEQES